MKPLIPLRPEGWTQTSLNQDEQSALTWYVLTNCPRKEAFITFARPDMLASKAKATIDEYIKQFFARKDVREYIEAYSETIDRFLHPQPIKQKPKGSIEERKAAAKSKLVEFAMDLANNIEQADDPEYVLKIADKCNLLDGEEEVEEAPRRYLPVSPCLNGCAYRMFCEENTEDMCQYCKYHAYGEENGIHYDKTEILDVPAELQRAISGTELEEQTE